MTRTSQIAAAVLLSAAIPAICHAGVTTTAVRETAEYVMAKFGRGAAGRTVDEIAETTARTTARYGDDVLPLVRRGGHDAIRVLDQAGDKAPDVLRLYARKGDEAMWIISQPRKLTIFLKHGDTAADALLKHPGIAEDLIEHFGDDAAGALNAISRGGAQRLAMVSDQGLLAATPRSRELLPVIRQYGDSAMDFIWKNKGALTVATILATFLADPQAYVTGAKSLIVEPVVTPILRSIPWAWIVVGALILVFLPFIVRRVRRAGDGDFR